MTKRILSAVILAGMITTSAFASDAREAVMGHGDGGLLFGKGSLSYDSMYNIFYNPAYVNDYKNWVIIEKGSDANGQAGFVSSFGAINAGAYIDAAGRNTYNTGAVQTFGVRPIDVFVGGDQGVKWGVGGTFTQKTAGSSYLGFHAGISHMNFEPFIAWSTSKVSDTTPSQKGSNMQAGLRYHWGDWTPYFVYSTEKTENLTTTEDKRTVMLLAISRSTKLGDAARLNYSFGWANRKFAHTGLTDDKNNFFPLELSLEGDATGWLTLRGGYQFLADDLNSHGLARIGATAHVSKVDVDWAFGRSTDTAGTGTTYGNVDSSSIGFDGSTFSKLSVSYKW